MTKEEIVAKVKALGLPKNSYVVFGSCPLTICGIRETNNINLMVTKEAYKILENRGWQKLYKGPKNTPVTFEVFEAHDNWDFSIYNPTLEDLLRNAIEFDGILFASIDDVKKWKKVSGRLKDLSDLKLIDEYLLQKA